jgi:hypothetical protein
VIALPPSLAGADQLTSASLVAGLALTFCGADGALAPVGVTAFDCADTGPGPPEFDACTVNVYDAPCVSPVTVTLVAGGDPDTVVADCATPALYGVTAYDVGAPPLDGADHETVADWNPADADTFVTCPGAAGRAAGANITSTQ